MKTSPKSSPRENRAYADQRAAGRGSWQGIEHGQRDKNAISFDELILLAKRFRDENSGKGRVKYAGRLMQLLDGKDEGTLVGR